jgi:hypothetical protein
MIDLTLPAFRPHPLLRGGHVQTIAGAFLPGYRSRYRARQHQVPLPDGDRLVLHDDTPADWRPEGGVCVLVHGLGGCHSSPYLGRISDRLSARGVRAFRLDLRGCGAGQHTARHHAHAGRSEDLAAAVGYVLHQCAASPVVVAGFSMGANIALKMLGEFGAAAPDRLVGAVTLAPPIDLVYCAKNIRRGANRLYDRSFVTHLEQIVRNRRKSVADLVDIPLRRLPPRLREFDERFTSRVIGFEGAMEYYAYASSGPYLAEIAVPTLVLTAADDPLIPVEMFDAYPRSEFVRLHVTSQGGHMGYVAAAGIDLDRRWMDWRVVDAVTMLCGRGAARLRTDVPHGTAESNGRHPTAATGHHAVGKVPLAGEAPAA